MAKFYSPLRYPGGKAGLSDFLKKVIQNNGIKKGTYVEPYAGGAGAALSLLVSEQVYQIFLNDKDPFISNFWNAVFFDSERFVKKISDSPISLEEWKKHQKRFKDKNFTLNAEPIEIGMTCFYLNRCNRSGIMSSGPIGGMKQDGKWKIDARFNKPDLIRRIEYLSLYKNRVKIYNLDAIEFLKYLFSGFNLQEEKLLIYLDPPYYQKGAQLYRMSYKDQDHNYLSEYLKATTNFRWVLSYDENKYINNLYQANEKHFLDLNYFVSKAKVGKELIISSDNCQLPNEYSLSPNQKIYKNEILIEVDKTLNLN